MLILDSTTAASARIGDSYVHYSHAVFFFRSPTQTVWCDLKCWSRDTDRKKDPLTIFLPNLTARHAKGRADQTL